MQGTMGTSLADLNTAASQSYDAWFAAQAAATPSLELHQSAGVDVNRRWAWFNNAVNGSDQLRQRMAFALSEILVVSQFEFLNRGPDLANYYDLLAKNALGNYRTLLGDISISLLMGKYLTFQANTIPSGSVGVRADENYAREIMQLLTIGLWQLNPDGTKQLDDKGNPIPTFTQSNVTGLADVFTGWSSPLGFNTWEVDYLDPMICYPEYHYSGAKTIVGGVVISAGGSCLADENEALNALFNHPNTAPFISKELIQRLVTSNPSPQYVSRVAAVFANDGQGVRGDLLAVAKAILTDPEAVAVGTSPGSGKLREPLLRLTALWRAFSASQGNGKFTPPIGANASTLFGQNVLMSPTVFNFFTPFYQPPGPIMTAGLVAPEFQITNEFTFVSTANELIQDSYEFRDSKGVGSVGIDGNYSPTPSDMLLHTAAWEPYAADAQTLVNQLGMVFMPGQMSAAMNSTLVNYVNAIPASDAANRVIEATSLLVGSPQYSVQR
jgi:uncharacterized protein (DUF1800 family)